MTAADDIKARIDIVDLVGEGVELRRAGRNFSARCPFHNERTPSFVVFPDRQTWHCFGACATGGDVFSFVMRREGIGFSDALGLLAPRAGVELTTSRVSKDHAQREERLKATQRAAAIFFHETLLEEKEAAGARAYLEKRGLSRETIADFRLGYCPRSRQAMERRLTNDGFTEQEMVAVGLLRRRDDGSLTNFFRGRLIIPIQDQRADYIAFGARALDDSMPKYVNSPQSDIFEKSATLYALHKAKDTIRQTGQGVIVEGYMDVLTAHQYGFTNVVASMGTALTQRQVLALTKLANRFVLALDPDAAGDEATLRSLESSWRILDRPPRQSTSVALTGPEPKAAPELRVMNLPAGQDPDALIRSDATLWPGLVEEATPVIDYVFDAVARRLDVTTVEGKAAATQRLSPLIHHAPNIYEFNARVAKLAKLLKEEDNVIKQAIGSGPSSQSSRRPKRDRPSGPAFSDVDAYSLEEYCLASLLRYPELRSLSSRLAPHHFLKSSNREIFIAYEEGVPTELLSEHLEEPVREELERVLTQDVQSVPHREREQGLEQCIDRLETRFLDMEGEAVQSQHAAGELSREDASAKIEAINERRRLIEDKQPGAYRHTATRGQETYA